MDPSPAARERRFSTFELLLLALLSALVVVANVALHIPIKVPGHSGVVWMALLVVARTAVPRVGAAVVAGALSGALAAFLGVGDLGPLVTALSYAAAGLGVELAASTLGVGGGLRCAVAGAAGNLMKLAVKALLYVGLGAPAGFVLLGVAFPVATYLVFGAAGGILGHWTVVALRRAGYFASIAEKR